MNDEEQVQELRTEVARLETSTQRLAVEIDRLGSALDRVRRLEDEQVELREQTTLAMFNALAAADQANATHEEFSASERDLAQRDRRRVHAARMGLMGMILLLPLVAAFVYAGLLNQVHELVDQTKTDLVRNCQVRNQQVEVTIRRELALAEVDEPATRAAHAQSADAYRRLIDDCVAKYGPEGNL